MILAIAYLSSKEFVVLKLHNLFSIAYIGSTSIETPTNPVDSFKNSVDTTSTLLECASKFSLILLLTFIFSFIDKFSLCWIIEFLFFITLDIVSTF